MKVKKKNELLLDCRNSKQCIMANTLRYGIFPKTKYHQTDDQFY